MSKNAGPAPFNLTKESQKMLQLNFVSLREQKPDHGEEIVFMQPVTAMESEGCELREATVEYVWAAVDPEGVLMGEVCEYTPGDAPMDEFRKEIMLGSLMMDEDWHWMPADEYWGAFDRAKRKPTLEEARVNFKNACLLLSKAGGMFAAAMIDDDEGVSVSYGGTQVGVQGMAAMIQQEHTLMLMRRELQNQAKGEKHD